MISPELIARRSRGVGLDGRPEDLRVFSREFQLLLRSIDILRAREAGEGEEVVEIADLNDDGWLDFLDDLHDGGESAPRVRLECHGK